MQRFAEQTRKKCRQFSAFPLRLSVFASKFVNFQMDSQNLDEKETEHNDTTNLQPD
jgi:hypothetical protein